MSEWVDGWMDGYICILKYKGSIVLLSASEEHSFQGAQCQNWLGQHLPSESVPWLEGLVPIWPSCARPSPAREMSGLLRSPGKFARQPGTVDSDSPGLATSEFSVHRPAS